MKKFSCLLTELQSRAGSHVLSRNGAASHGAVPMNEESAKNILKEMQAGNAAYRHAKDKKVSQAKRDDTADHGQHPYAVIVTCSDSRVPAELIFNAGIGELFIIRTAGNVVGDYELGSIEYGAEHLHAPVVMVLGHTGCGAVAAALSGECHGHITDIVNEISVCIPRGCAAAEAEIRNVQHSIDKIRTSQIMTDLEAQGKVAIIGGIYDIHTGKVTYLDDTAV